MTIDTDSNEEKKQLNYEQAGLLHRLAAMFYDAFLVLALWFLIAGILVLLNSGEAPPVWMSQFLLFPLLIVATIGFNVWFWTHGGQTLGMRAWRIKVSDNNGQALDIKKSIKRCFFAVISLLAFGIGYLWLLIDKEKKTWHDRWSETQVIYIPKKKK